MVEYKVASGYTWTQSHTYAGAEPFASDNGSYTVAPGQYTFVHDPIGDSKEDTALFDPVPKDENGQIYVVAHAVSCG